MDRDRLILGIAAVFAGITVLLVVLAFAKQLFLLFVALPFGATTYFMWHHATGRLEERTRRRARARARAGSRMRQEADARRQTGAGPRTEWQTRQTVGGRAAQTQHRHDAYRTLGLDPGADEAEVRRAYREKVKEVHPDAEGGDEESFKRVTRAYETLRE